MNAVSSNLKHLFASFPFKTIGVGCPKTQVCNSMTGKCEDALLEIPDAITMSF